MATARKTRLSDYTQLKTIPAMSGILFVLAAAVQFLEGTVEIGATGHALEPQYAMGISLVCLVIAFASSQTRNFQSYSRAEQGVIGLTLVLIVGVEYVSQISDLLATNMPVTGFAAFIISFLGWGVLAR